MSNKSRLGHMNLENEMLVEVLRYIKDTTRDTRQANCVLNVKRNPSRREQLRK